MSLDELEAAFRERQQAQGSPLVIIALQIREDDIRALRPRLAAKQESLSEHVRELIRADTR